MPEKRCNTGIDPAKNFEHFIARDPFEAMHKSRGRNIIPKAGYSVEIPKGKVPYGTTKYTFRLGLDANARLERERFGYNT